VSLCFGVLDYYYGWNCAHAERYLRLAIERDSTSADAHFWLALCLGVVGRVDESLAVAREGLRLEPHSPNNRAAAAWPLIMVGRFEEATVETAAAITLGDSPFALWTHGMVLSALGRHAEAIAVHREAVELTGGRYSYYTALLAHTFAHDGDVDEARKLLAELDRRALTQYVPPYDRALVLEALGEDDAALEALERAVHERNAFLWARLHFPCWRRLAGHPRFKALTAQLARRAPVAPSVARV
jgi:tetratricopeptide (TPR) repeat protein